MSDEESLVRKKRVRRVKGSSPDRKSRRIRGASADELEDLEFVGKEAKNLFQRGGKGGKNFEDTSKWEYFPHHPKSLLSPSHRKTLNKNIFQSLNTLLDNDFKEEFEKRENNEGTYQLMDTVSLEKLINTHCVCNCFADDPVMSFIEFCDHRDNHISHSLRILFNEWKINREQKGKTELKVENIALQSCVTLKCNNCHRSTPLNTPRTKFHGTNYKGKPCRTENCSWFPINLKLVLATLATGLGPADIPTICSFLGLPHLRSFSKRQYYRIESLIGKCLIETAEVSMKEALDKEIIATEKYKKKIGKPWQTFLNKIGLTVGYDMGWSKRSSGNRYDSMSGHAFFTGCHTKKIIAAQITSKKCSICTAAEARGSEIEEHSCPRNFQGSSKAMEAYGALSLTKKIFNDSNGKTFVESMVIDDDSSTRALVSHESVRGKGQLPRNIPEPNFLADTSHRTKVVAKAIFVLAHLPRSQSKCTNIDALRIKKYHGYMIKQARHLTLDEIRLKCKAVIEHLFDNHEFCDMSWCKPKRVAQEVDNIIKELNLPPSSSLPLAQTVSPRKQNLPPTPRSLGPTDNKNKTNTASRSFYHSKANEPELYNQLINAYKKYTTPERLQESLHLFDTQVNESLHHVVSKYAPKHKNYSTTMSLSHRIAIVIGIHNIGHFAFWSSVFRKLGLHMSKDLINNLHFLDKQKNNKREYQSRHDIKVKRIKTHLQKMSDLMQKQKNE